jgi:hypothetical protein
MGKERLCVLKKERKWGMVPRKSFLWCFEEFFQVIDFWVHHAADAY